MAIAAYLAVVLISKAYAANKQANQAVKAGNFAAEQKSRETVLRASAQKSSFLNSGLTLEGTPNTVLDDTYATGLNDIKQIHKNAKNNASNILGAARTDMIETVGKAYAGGAMGQSGSGGLFDSDNAAYAANSAGQGEDAYDYFQAQDNDNTISFMDVGKVH